MSIEQNRDLAFKCFDAINRQDAGGLAAVLSPKWAEEIRGWFAEADAAWPRLWMDVVDTVAEGDRVWCRVRTSGTRGSCAGNPEARREWTSTSVWFLRIADEKIVEVEWLFDELSLMRQFGAIITPTL